MKKYASHSTDKPKKRKRRDVKVLQYPERLESTSFMKYFKNVKFKDDLFDYIKDQPKEIMSFSERKAEVQRRRYEYDKKYPNKRFKMKLVPIEQPITRPRGRPRKVKLVPKNEVIICTF